MPSASKQHIRQWIITLGAAVLVVSMLPVFFRYIQAKPGFTPWDPVLASFSPTDLSTPIFVVLYSAVALSLAGLVKRQCLLLRGLQAYVLLLVLRMVSMTIITLEAPSTWMPLTDPITQIFYPDPEPFRKDLFFSGHTATMFLLFLMLRGGRYAVPLLVATVFIGAAVLAQHVHWTVDVLFAPPAAWSAWWLSGHTIRWGSALTSEGGSA